MVTFDTSCHGVLLAVSIHTVFSLQLVKLCMPWASRKATLFLIKREHFLFPKWSLRNEECTSGACESVAKAGVVALLRSCTVRFHSFFQRFRYANVLPDCILKRNSILVGD
ncbi:hypothetical protein BJV82DRAFT_628999 [Fennellomyces sp. T-0311]|nr:hypothetical protein BJV82DRAFT_628999 [Fennellomyces sp. T-0311]